jgi:NTP pyrophosphatase (non-canonical NTP hydrolase)
MNDDTAFSDLRSDSNGCVKLKTGTTYYDALRLSAFLSTESNELLDLFRHVQDDEMDEAVANQHEEVKGELGDILFILVRFAQFHDVDLAEAFEDKLEANKEIYPVDQVKGSNTPKEGL